MKSKLILSVFSVLLLTGCFSGTVFSVYRPYAHGYGYADFTLSEKTVEVSFSGGLGDNATFLKKLAQIRAAEIGKSRNFNYMSIGPLSVNDIPISETTSSSFTPRDTTQKTSRDEARTQKSISGRREVIMQVRFCKEDCGNFLEIETVLKEARDAGLLPSQNQVKK